MMTLIVTDKQLRLAKEFEENHECKWKTFRNGEKYFGATGGGISFLFQSSSLFGWHPTAICPCGEKSGLMDDEDFADL